MNTTMNTALNTTNSAPVTWDTEIWEGWDAQPTIEEVEENLATEGIYCTDCERLWEVLDEANEYRDEVYVSAGYKGDPNPMRDEDDPRMQNVILSDELERALSEGFDNVSEYEEWKYEQDCADAAYIEREYWASVL